LGSLPAVERAEKIGASQNGDPGFAAAGDGELRVRLYLTGDAPLLVAPAAAVLADHGSSLTDVKLGTPTLEDVFIHLTGRTLR
jgi:ABC-2 type transport system ATP-binding protein